MTATSHPVVGGTRGSHTEVGVLLLLLLLLLMCMRDFESSSFQHSSTAVVVRVGVSFTSVDRFLVRFFAEQQCGRAFSRNTVVVLLYLIIYTAVIVSGSPLLQTVQQQYMHTDYT